MARRQIRCHGDEKRFEAVADFIYLRFGKSVRYIADVAGGRGLLSRYLNKKHNYDAEVIDPRGYALCGVPSRQTEYKTEMAMYYDLIVGLHPDGATREIVESAAFRPVLVVPCCNEWDRETKLDARGLIMSIVSYLTERGIPCETVELDFKGPKNVGIVTGYRSI